MKLKVADFRPIYMWAGPGTIRMNKLKGGGAVDEELHLSAYTEEAISKFKEMGVSIIFATFSWGFAPEEEREDWESFRHFAHLCHQAKLNVAAYVQPTNMVVKEWFNKHPHSKDWVCHDGEGKLID